LNSKIYDLAELAIRCGKKQNPDLLEVRGEDIAHTTILSEKMTVKETRVFRRVGVGIRAYVGGATGYSFTTRSSPAVIEKAVHTAIKTAKMASSYADLKLKPAKYKPVRTHHSLQVKKHPKNVEFQQKIEMLKRAEAAARDKGLDVATTRGSYGEAYGKKLFLNSEDGKISHELLLVTMRVEVVSRRGSVLVNARDSHGGSFGLGAFKDQYSPETLGSNAAKWAAEKLEGKKAPAGTFRALINGVLAGVMAHESFGHLSEFDFVLTGGSPLSGMMNQQLGSEYATIVDSGVLELPSYPGFTVPYDDEGIEARPVMLLNKGVLKGYLHSRGTAGVVGTEPTGNGRAVDYRFEPICRMRNTYFTAGELNVEEALKLLGEGIYACNTAGGQVSLDGTFMFKAVRGYWVENGEPKYPFRDVAIRGHILDFLKNIQARCDDLQVQSTYFGGCGKGGQSPLPVGVGGPHLLLKQASFGGEQKQG
jgi:TldD protein